MLAHNIHKDCPLGVVRGLSQDHMVRSTLLHHLLRGHAGENQGFNAKVYQIDFKCFVLAIYGSLDQNGELLSLKYIKVL